MLRQPEVFKSYTETGLQKKSLSLESMEQMFQNY